MHTRIKRIAEERVAGLKAVSEHKAREAKAAEKAAEAAEEAEEALRCCVLAKFLGWLLFSPQWELVEGGAGEIWGEIWGDVGRCSGSWSREARD